LRQKKYMLWTRVDENIRRLVERLAKSKGLTMSEYLRQLIIEDLDKRSIFTTLLKHNIINSNATPDVERVYRDKKGCTESQ
jgi:antitoxin component of RelBE/YafQ-DinJ toxin-antitoxin module